MPCGYSRAPGAGSGARLLREDLGHALEAGDALKDYETIDAETAELNYAELRKRERPFVMSLDPTDPGPVERHGPLLA